MDNTESPHRKSDTIALLVGQAFVTIIGIVYISFLQFGAAGCAPATCNHAALVIYVAIALMALVTVSTAVAVAVVLGQGGRAIMFPIIGVALVAIIAIAAVVTVKSIVLS